MKGDCSHQPFCLEKYWVNQQCSGMHEKLAGCANYTVTVSLSKSDVMCVVSAYAIGSVKAPACCSKVNAHTPIPSVPIYHKNFRLLKDRGNIFFRNFCVNIYGSEWTGITEWTVNITSCSKFTV